MMMLLHSLALGQRPASSKSSLRQDATEFEPLFSPVLQRAIEGETRMRAARGFDTQFFAALDEKRARSRTIAGQLERLVELEISGVAVWRLLGSGAAGSVLPGLILAFCLAAPAKHPISLPQSEVIFNVTDLRRFWEEDAWKNPFRNVTFSLLDPHFNLGGSPCGSPQAA